MYRKYIYSEKKKKTGDGNLLRFQSPVLHQSSLLLTVSDQGFDFSLGPAAVDQQLVPP